MAVLVGVGIVVAVAVDIRSRGDRTEVTTELTLGQVLDQLAIAIDGQWQDEARLRRLNDPHPLPVAWQPADSDLVEPWDALCKSASGWPGGPPTDPAGWASSPAELAGADNDLADRLAKVPTGRLIVLGEPGAGKTMLLIRLVLELLARRLPGGPVPVLVPLAGWDPVDQDLWTWLEARLIVDHPGLAEPAPPQAGATSRVRALVERRLLLPILDGLDELPVGAWSRAVTRLNDALIPGQGLVLASRAAAYRQAVTPADPAAGLPVRLWGAAGISLRPLAPDTVRAYLRRDAASPAAAARWDPVLATLGTSAPVAQALTTPLLVGLARAIFNPRPGEHTGALPNPAELCDTTQFPTPNTIQEHLFDAFIPAAYRPHPDRARRPAWTAEQAEQWLAFLAHHLEHDRQGTTNLAWWELRRTLRRPLLWLTTGLSRGLLVGLAYGLVFGLVPGFLFGLGGAILAASAVELADATPARGWRWNWPDRGDLVIGLAWGLVAGFVFWRWVGLTLGLVFGSLIGSAVAVTNTPGTMPADLTVAADPRAALARDRRTYGILAIIFGLFGGLTIWLGSGFAFGFAGAIGVALAVAVTFGSIYPLFHTAWGAFGMVRCWLALRRRLPWRLMSFLADAHQKRGLLRQAGAVYQFRHADFQRRLATRAGP